MLSLQQRLFVLLLSVSVSVAYGDTLWLGNDGGPLAVETDLTGTPTGNVIAKGITGLPGMEVFFIPALPAAKSISVKRMVPSSVRSSWQILRALVRTWLGTRSEIGYGELNIRAW